MEAPNRQESSSFAAVPAIVPESTQVVEEGTPPTYQGSYFQVINRSPVWWIQEKTLNDELIEEHGPFRTASQAVRHMMDIVNPQRVPVPITWALSPIGGTF